MKMHVLFLFIVLALPARLAAQLESETNTYTDLKYALENRTKVTSLSLSGQKLTKIPKEVFELTNLRELDLGKNKIKEIPVEIGKLKKLEILNLSFNKVEELPEEIGNLKRLQSLDLRKNKVWKLPEAMGQLTHLETLILNGNPVYKLPLAMDACASLKYVDVRNTEMDNGDRSVLQARFPGVEFFFSNGCNCGPNN